jgi:hypothetical protein
MATPYRIPVLEKFAYQPPVIDKDLTSGPVSAPAKGDRYIVASPASGPWTGQENNIAWYDGTQWKFDVPAPGWTTYVEDELLQYTFNGTVWAKLDSGTTLTFDADLGTLIAEV